MSSRKSPKLCDVGLALRRSRTTSEAWLPCGRLLVCSGPLAGESIRRAASLLELRAGAAPSAALPVVAVHLPEDLVGKYKPETLKPWLLKVVAVFLDAELRYPVLLCGGSEAALVVALLLMLLGVTEDLATQVADPTAGDRLVGKFCAKLKGPGLVDQLLGELDCEAVRRSLVGGPDSTAARDVETRWLRSEVQTLCKLANGATKDEDGRPDHWYGEIVDFCADFAGGAEPADAAVMLCWQGWSLSRLNRFEEANRVLRISAALNGAADGNEGNQKLAKMLEKELAALPHEVEELRVLPMQSALVEPGDPHAGMELLLFGGEDGPWQTHRCPAAFSWLRCGELAASASPKKEHLPVLRRLQLKHVSAELLGEPRPLEEHFEAVVESAAAAILAGSGCLLHCADGFGDTCVALACFLVAHGLTEQLREEPGQPQMTAGEAVEVLRSMRSGTLATAESMETVHTFAQHAWAKHNERMSNLFAAATAANTCFSDGPAEEAPAAPKGRGPERPPGGSTKVVVSRKAPPSARVVKQPGDGNCLFHSLAYGIGGCTATTARAEICAFMERNTDMNISGTPLAMWVQLSAGTAVGPYAKRMAKSGTWGGDLEIAVFAQMKKVNVHVYNAGFKLTVPFDVAGSSRTVNVCYSGVHYDALVL